MVGDIGFAGERDADNFHGLVVVQRLEHEAVKGFDVERWTAVGGLSGTIGQVLSLDLARRGDAARMIGTTLGRANWGQARGCG